MQTSSASLATWALAALTTVFAGCGGGEAPRTSAQDFVARIAPAAARTDRLRALASGGGATAAAAGPITNAQLIQWAQLEYPDLFPGTPTTIPGLPHEGKTYDVWAFANGNYLGVTRGENHVWGLGDFTVDALVDFGAVQSYADLVCTRVDCGGGSSTGALNGCTLPASQMLAQGNRFDATYSNTTFLPAPSSGEFTMSSLVDGPATFEGQSAVKVTSTISGQQGGQAIDVTSTSFEQAAPDETIRTLGSETQASAEGFTFTTRTVNNPADANTEFTLQVGQSLTRTFSVTSTTSFGGQTLPPSTTPVSATYTYEARETITVGGRSFDTCRYKEVQSGAEDISYSWYIFGKGLPARMETRNAAGTVVDLSELKSASINGQPI